MRWMFLRFEAPLASFGGEAIDAHGIIRDFPARSMVTGLFANALGWTRRMRFEHQGLQERIVFGAVHDSNPATARMIDYQTAQLGAGDKAWSTRGYPIGRAGGSGTYKGAHQRWRHYHSDLRMSMVVRFVPEYLEPTMDTLAAALVRPARPLFIGRKACLPTGIFFHRWIETDDICDALRGVIPAGKQCEAQWSISERAQESTSITDERDWMSGLHGGGRLVCRGRLDGTGVYR